MNRMLAKGKWRTNQKSPHPLSPPPTEGAWSASAGEGSMAPPKEELSPQVTEVGMLLYGARRVSRRCTLGGRYRRKARRAASAPVAAQLTVHRTVEQNCVAPLNLPNPFGFKS